MFGPVIDELASYRIMDYAFDKGITFFDTAEIYGEGVCEGIIGNWMALRKCRQQITLCSKFWTPDVPGWGRAEYMRRALRRSLERLRTDYIDLYLIHFPDPSVPIGETLEALTAEVRAGHIKAIGCSNYSSTELQDALDTAHSLGCSRFEVIQPSYSLGTNPVGVDSYPVGLFELEDNIFPICRKERIGVTTYSPLAVGMLSGKYTKREPPEEGSRFARNSDYVRVYLTDRNVSITDKLRAKAAEFGVPMARLAMGWAMSHPLVTAVIIGARLTEHIDSALEVQNFKMEPVLRREMTSWTR